MGGTDDSSNFICLTIEEHAEAHRLLYEQYGKREDYMAWKGLSGQLGKEDLIKDKLSLNSSRPGESNPFYGMKHTEETKRKISEKKMGHTYNKGIPKSEEHKQKISEFRKASAQRYKFEHQDGRIFEGSTRELADMLKSNPAEPWKLVKGIYKTHKGWKVIK